MKGFPADEMEGRTQQTQQQRSNRKLILFDLDETLVHAFVPQDIGKKRIVELRDDMVARRRLAEQSTISPKIYKQPLMFVMPRDSLKQPGQQCVQWIGDADDIKIAQIEYIVVLRPYLIHFLAALCKQKQFDIGIFSMGVQQYVDCIVDAIQDKVREVIGNPQAVVFKERHYRHEARTHEDEGTTSKDLTIVRNTYKPAQVLLIDNVSANFASNTKNCAPIRPFTLQTMYQREFGVDQNNVKTFTFDMGLVRLEAFIKQIDPRKSITDQNVFIFRSA